MAYRFSVEDDTTLSKPSLLDDEQKEGEFDELYQAAQIKESQVSEEEPPVEEEAPQDTATNVEPEPDNSSNEQPSNQDTPVGEEEPALESVFLNHEISYAACLSLEEGEFEGAGTEVLRAVGRGLTYLAEAGLEYGTIAAKHIA